MSRLRAETIDLFVFVIAVPIRYYYTHGECMNRTFAQMDGKHGYDCSPILIGGCSDLSVCTCVCTIS